MASFSIRTTTVTTTQFIVSCGPLGAPYADVISAIRAASDAANNHNINTQNDDWLRVIPGDDEIIFEFTVDTRSGAGHQIPAHSQDH